MEYKFKLEQLFWIAKYQIYQVTKMFLLSVFYLWSCGSKSKYEETLYKITFIEKNVLEEQAFKTKRMFKLVLTINRMLTSH